jgi:hypothetical protein
VRGLVRLLTGVGIAATVAFTAVPTFAASITEPSGDVVVVKVESGDAAPFTVEAKGFEPYQSVFIEQCNGRVPTDDNWRPAVDCDFGSSPAAAIADTGGTVTFSASDLNHALHPFVGPSPQGLFNCLPPQAPSPHNDLDDYRDCQIRVSSNNTRPTNDQVFLRLRLPVLPARTAAGTTGSGSSGSGQVGSDPSGSGKSASGSSSSGGAAASASATSSGSGRSEVPIIGALMLGTAAVAGGAAFVLHRRRTRQVAA